MTITLQDLGVAPGASTPGDPPHMVGCERMWLRLAGTSRVYSSAVEHRIADPAVAGSIPAAPLTNTFLIFFFFFQCGRHRHALRAAACPEYVFLWPNWTRRLTTNQKIGGSSPSWNIFLFKIFVCGW